MYDQPRLSDEEWNLVVELLERERGELPVEIHHTQVAEYRTGLQHRSVLVQGLLERLRAPAGVEH